MKSVAIMQPYIFPYLGYFQLLESADEFVFYDDVNFIKRGWVNRNNILLNGNKFMFNIPLIGASQNKLINEVEVAYGDPKYASFTTQLEHAYRKAPQFEAVMPLVSKLMQQRFESIGELAIESIRIVWEYLEQSVEFSVSSQKYSDSQGIDRQERLITISKQAGADRYVNAIGGRELYTKEGFAESGLPLFFLESQLSPYDQLKSNTFVPGLSMLDLLMNLSKQEILEQIRNYKLI